MHTVIFKCFQNIPLKDSTENIPDPMKIRISNNMQSTKKLSVGINGKCIIKG